MQYGYTSIANAVITIPITLIQSIGLSPKDMFAKYEELDRSCDMLIDMVDEFKAALSYLACNYSETKNMCPLIRYIIMKDVIKAMIEVRDLIVDIIRKKGDYSSAICCLNVLTDSYRSITKSILN